MTQAEINERKYRKQRAIADADPGLRCCPVCRTARPLTEFLPKRGDALTILCAHCRTYRSLRQRTEQRIIRVLRNDYPDTYARIVADLEKAA